MSLQQLLDYKNQWRTPFLFYIDYTSSIAPDNNTVYGIASKEMLIAFSYSGNIYRCVDSTNWVLCSKDWDDLPNDLVLRRIFDKDANNSHMIEIHWQDGLQFYVDGSTMVFNTANFQAGVSTLYNKCTSWGVTPSSNSPTDVANAIDTIANNRWEAGRLEVTSNPNNYNLFTPDQYNNHYNEGYNAGLSAGQSSVAGSYNIYFVVNARGGSDGGSWMKYEDQITINISTGGTPTLGSPSFTNAQIRGDQGEYYNLRKN